MVVLRREEGDAGIVTILPDQRECFRQQLDASEVVGLLPPVVQPEAALVILEEVLPGDACLLYTSHGAGTCFLTLYRTYSRTRWS